RRLRAVDDRAKCGVLGAVLRVPAEVLACDAHAALLAVERVQRTHVAEQYLAHFCERRLRQLVAGREEMSDLAKDPWAALRRASEHQRIGPRLREHVARLARRID